MADNLRALYNGIADQLGGGQWTITMLPTLDVLHIVLAAFGTLLAFTVTALTRLLFDRLNKVETRMDAITESHAVFAATMASQQAHIDNSAKTQDAIFATLRRIEEKLDGKADKPGH